MLQRHHLEHANFPPVVKSEDQDEEDDEGDVDVEAGTIAAAPFNRQIVDITSSESRTRVLFTSIEDKPSISEAALHYLQRRYPRPNNEEMRAVANQSEPSRTRYENEIIYPWPVVFGMDAFTIREPEPTEQLVNSRGSVQDVITKICISREKAGDTDFPEPILCGGGLWAAKEKNKTLRISIVQTSSVVSKAMANMFHVDDQLA